MIACFAVSLGVSYLGPCTELKQKLEREGLSAALVAKSSQAGASLMEASVARPRELLEESEGVGGER